MNRIATTQLMPIYHCANWMQTIRQTKIIDLSLA